MLCVCVCVCVCVLIAQLCLTLCNPMDCSPQGSFVHGILQARILEWVAIPLSRASSQPRIWTQVSCIAGRSEPPGNPVKFTNVYVLSFLGTKLDPISQPLVQLSVTLLEFGQWNMSESDVFFLQVWPIKISCGYTPLSSPFDYHMERFTDERS